MEKTKPDLMAASGTQRLASSKRILAQLEHGARPAAHPARATGWTIDGWTIGLFALLLLMCSVAWMMHDKTITPKTFRHDYSSGSSPSVARRVAESTPAAEPPATIVNETAPGFGVDSDDGKAAQPSHGRVAAVADKIGPAPLPKLAAPAARTAAAAAPASTTTTAIPASRTAAATASGPTAAAAGDTDVTLLTALMAHAGKPAAVTPERPRDVVERQAGDTTAQLLARCKQLGLIEGMLCRSRICSGRWEADAACRAPSH